MHEEKRLEGALDRSSASNALTHSTLAVVWGMHDNKRLEGALEAVNAQITITKIIAEHRACSRSEGSTIGLSVRLEPWHARQVAERI